MSAIFISYRREDAEDSARALYESLLREFGKERLFMDVEAIALGTDFRQAVESSLDNCGVFLAVIGPNWLDAKLPNDPSGRRRLDTPGDYVRQEVATALKRGSKLPVIPVLVHGAAMPSPDQLPDDLKDLAYRNALTLSHLDWDGNVQKLVSAIKPRLGGGEPRDAAAVAARGAAPKIQRDAAPAVAPAEGLSSSGAKKAMLFGVPALLIAAVVGYFALKPSPKPASTTQPASAAGARRAGGEGPSQLSSAGQNSPERNEPASGERPAFNERPSPAVEAGAVMVSFAANSSFKGSAKCTPACRLGIDGQVVAKPYTGQALRLSLSPGEHRFQIANANGHCEGTFSVAQQQTSFTPRWSSPTTCEMRPAEQAPASDQTSSPGRPASATPLVVTLGFAGSGWDKRSLQVDGREVSESLRAPLRLKLAAGQHNFVFVGPNHQCRGSFNVAPGSTRFTMQWPAADNCMITPAGS